MLETSQSRQCWCQGRQSRTPGRWIRDVVSSKISTTRAHDHSICMEAAREPGIARVSVMRCDWTRCSWNLHVRVFLRYEPAGVGHDRKRAHSAQHAQSPSDSRPTRFRLDEARPDRPNDAASSPGGVEESICLRICARRSKESWLLLFLRHHHICEFRNQWSHNHGDARANQKQKCTQQDLLTHSVVRDKAEEDPEG